MICIMSKLFQVWVLFCCVYKMDKECTIFILCDNTDAVVLYFYVSHVVLTVHWEGS